MLKVEFESRTEVTKAERAMFACVLAIYELKSDHLVNWIMNLATLSKDLHSSFLDLQNDPSNNHRSVRLLYQRDNSERLSES